MHQHYRKLCHLLADFDEWGQTTVLNLMLRYGRTHFASPFTKGEMASGDKKKFKKPKKAFYSDDDSKREQHSVEDETEEDEEEAPEMAEDHHLLLKSCLMLRCSTNSGVLLALASLFHYLAPPQEGADITRALVRVSRNRRAIAFGVLSSISTMSAARPEAYRQYIKDFFVCSTDPGTQN
jgi:AP-3 complex subunit beta